MPGGIAHNTNGDFWDGYHTDPQQCGTCGGPRTQITVDGDFWKCSCGNMWEKKDPPPEPEAQAPAEQPPTPTPQQDDTWQIVITAKNFDAEELASLFELIFRMVHAETHYQDCSVDLKHITP